MKSILFAVLLFFVAGLLFPLSSCMSCDDGKEVVSSEFSGYISSPIYFGNGNIKYVYVIFHDIQEYGDVYVKYSSDNPHKLTVETGTELDTPNLLWAFLDIEICSYKTQLLDEEKDGPYRQSHGYETDNASVVFRDPADTEAFLDKLEAVFAGR